jgi:hypothetical protein
MSLSPEQGHKILELLRDYVRVQAEIRSLAAILTLAEAQTLPPVVCRR